MGAIWQVPKYKMADLSRALRSWFYPLQHVCRIVYSYNNFNKIGFKLHFEFLINYHNKIIHTYLHFKLSIIMFIFYI